MINNLDLRLWKLQRHTALLLLPLLIFHVGFQAFFIGTENIDFDGVAARLGVAGYVAVDVLLLLTAVAHAVLGLRSVMQDRAASAPRQRTASRLAIAIGVVAVAFGAIALTAFN